MNRIQSISTRFLGLFKFLIVFLPLCTLIKWIMMSPAFLKSPWSTFTLLGYNGGGSINEGRIEELMQAQWTFLTKLLAFSADMLALLPILISLYALIKIFKHYQYNEIFSADNARSYRLIGWLFIADALLFQPLSGSLMSIAVSFSNPVGQRYISLSFWSNNIETLFCGAVVIVISWVMLEASKLHEEQQYTI